AHRTTWLRSDLLVRGGDDRAGLPASLDPAAVPAPPPVAPTASAGDVGLETPPPAEPPPAEPAPAEPAPEPAPAPARPDSAPAAPRTRAVSVAERCRSTVDADQRSCLFGQLPSIDARLTRVYQALIADYRRQAGGEREPLTVRRLRSEQRLWLAERDRVCRLRTRERSGERWGAARLPCFRELSARRAAELATRRPTQTAEVRPRRVGTGEFGYR
ncbi:lysozyme inhibitor LprI family protein, partial [Roseisolibacter sp. H3M3-2]|uniref:lysozyme inhibitor LprI family protein n=1 Tax=Roseisolibacter sp. H3M3-2 TaxID=3031323 RepID=UPI0023DB1FF8